MMNSMQKILEAIDKAHEVQNSINSECLENEIRYAHQEAKIAADALNRLLVYMGHGVSDSTDGTDKDFQGH